MAQTILPGEDQGLYKGFEGTAISQSLGPIAKDALKNGLFDCWIVGFVAWRPGALHGLSA